MLRIADLGGSESLGVGINGLDHDDGLLPRGAIMIIYPPPPTSPEVDKFGVCMYCEDIPDVIICDAVAVADEDV